VAVIRARFLASQTDALFAKCRTMPNTDDDSTTLFTLSISVDEIFGRRTAVASDIQPGEEIAAAIGMATLQDHLDGKPPTPQLQSALEAQLRAPAQPALAAGMSFKEAIAYYLENSEIKITSKNTYRHRLEHAQEFFGKDRDVRFIERDDLLSYKQHAMKTLRSVGTQGLTIRQLITMLNFLRDTKSWGGQLSTRKMIPKKTGPASEDRDAFTLDQLVVLFSNAKQYKSKNPAKYWATVALPLLGCRLAELCQINLATDLQQDQKSGVWFINLAETPDEDDTLRQSMKNGMSWRKVPIHSALAKHGFIDYLQLQMKDGFTRPFERDWPVYLLKQTGEQASEEELHQWGRRAANWGSLEIKKLRESGAIDDPKKLLGYFHSMRHTFSVVLDAADIQLDKREAAMGHKYGGEQAERYAKFKQNPVLMSEQVYEPGLAKIAALLDNL